MKIGIIADIHANAVALEAVLKDMGSVDAIICAGDIVGFNPFPNETLELLRKYNVKAVRGEFDNAVLSGDTQWFNREAAQTINWTTRQLTRENTKYLASLPEQIELNGLAVYHGNLQSIRDMLAETSHEKFCSLFDPVDARVIVYGHSHVPLDKLCGDKRIINPGSVGQPRDDDCRASYGIWDTEKGVFIVKRVDYDFRAVQKRIEEAGLPRFVADRLSYGK